MEMSLRYALPVRKMFGRETCPLLFAGLIPDQHKRWGRYLTGSTYMPCVTSCKVTAENKGSYETEQLGMCPSPNPSRRGYCTGANRHKVSEQYPTSN